MPYPKPDHPGYCPGSGRLVGIDVPYPVCPTCGRHITANHWTGRLFAHLRNLPRASEAAEYVRSREA